MSAVASPIAAVALVCYTAPMNFSCFQTQV